MYSMAQMIYKGLPIDEFHSHVKFSLFLMCALSQVLSWVRPMLYSSQKQMVT